MSIFDVDEAEATRAVLAEARTGLLRAMLLFGSVAVALALVIAPAAERGARYAVAGGAPQLDTMTTGSIGAAAEPNAFVVRRSVLQPAGAGPCVIYTNGASRGIC